MEKYVTNADLSDRQQGRRPSVQFFWGEMLAASDAAHLAEESLLVGLECFNFFSLLCAGELQCLQLCLQGSELQPLIHAAVVRWRQHRRSREGHLWLWHCHGCNGPHAGLWNHLQQPVNLFGCGCGIAGDGRGTNGGAITCSRRAVSIRSPSVTAWSKCAASDVQTELVDDAALSGSNLNCLSVHPRDPKVRCGEEQEKSQGYISSCTFSSVVLES